MPLSNGMGLRASRALSLSLSFCGAGAARGKAWMLERRERETTNVVPTVVKCMMICFRCLTSRWVKVMSVPQCCCNDEQTRDK